MTTRTLEDKIIARLKACLTFPDYPPTDDWAYSYYNNDPEWYDGQLPNGSDVRWASGYAEPGYPDARVVLFSNWNDEAKYVRGPWREGLNPKWVVTDNTASRLYKSLERLDGVGLEWSDEWTTCDECDKAFRTQADSYSWTMYGAWNGDGYSCGDCIKNDPEAYIEDYVNDSDKALTMLSENDLEKAGWVKVPADDTYSGSYHSGWYGRTDNPSDIMDELHSVGLSDVIFAIDSVGQFEVAFSPYVRAQEVVDTLGQYKSLIESAETTIEYYETH